MMKEAFLKAAENDEQLQEMIWKQEEKELRQKSVKARTKYKRAKDELNQINQKLRKHRSNKNALPNNIANQSK